MLIILHYQGAYNIYNTISDGAAFESALTFLQLKNWIKIEYGDEGLKQLPERLKRAHKAGTSSMISNSLEDQICCNRSGPNEKHLSFKKFVDQFLTLKEPIEKDAAGVYEIAEKGLPVCPFFEQIDENFQRIPLDDPRSPTYTHCFHPNNKRACEGNCQKNLCPFSKFYKRK